MENKIKVLLADNSEHFGIPCANVMRSHGLDVETVEKDGRPVELTAKEYDLLLLFLRNRNIALYRERIYEEVWGGEFDPDSRTVDIHVQRLKRKMGLEHSIVSVRNVGYRLEVSET